ncbi:MAG: 3-ketoacyl-ACP reductase [Alphaproteobacteria bacterium]
MTHPLAIVTGAGRGIGLSIAQHLADAGFDILATDIGGENFDAVQADLEGRGARADCFIGDIADLSSHAALVARALEKFGRIDCLVNNAGIASPQRGDFFDLSPQNFDKVLAVNLRGTIFLTQAVARAMLDAQGSDPKSIITITSVNAQMAAPERTDYAISKAGLSMFTKSLTLRLAPHNIAVFEVRPGIIATDMTAVAKAKYDALIDDGLVPAGRWGQGDDVGRAVAALATGGLGFATGSVITVDGGLSVPKL